MLRADADARGATSKYTSALAWLHAIAQLRGGLRMARLREGGAAIRSEREDGMGSGTRRPEKKFCNKCALLHFFLDTVFTELYTFVSCNATCCGIDEISTGRIDNGNEEGSQEGRKEGGQEDSKEEVSTATQHQQATPSGSARALPEVFKTLCSCVSFVPAVFPLCWKAR